MCFEQDASKHKHSRLGLQPLPICDLEGRDSVGRGRAEPPWAVLWAGRLTVQSDEAQRENKQNGSLYETSPSSGQ